ECRRCPTRVVDMANHLIARNVNRPVLRVLQPRPENGRGDVRIVQYTSLEREIAGVAATVQQLIAQGYGPGEILILAQRGVIGTPIYEALRARGVPTKSYYAESELDAESTQHRFALLKLFVNRDDRVALRWLLGYGSGSWLAAGYRRVRAYSEENGVEPWDALSRLASGELAIPYTNEVVRRFRLLVATLQEL